MSRTVVVLICCMASLSCRGDAEKLPPPLPQDGTALPYSQVLARLQAQVTTAKEEHFLNRWDSVAEAAAGLQQTAPYLMRASDMPVSQKPAITKASTEISGNIAKLRDAARRKDQAETLELIRLLHNQIRELQELK